VAECGKYNESTGEFNHRKLFCQQKPGGKPVRKNIVGLGEETQPYRMELLKKILFVLSTTFSGACIVTAIASYFSYFTNGWDAIAAALGYLFFGALSSLIISIIVVRKLPPHRLNVALMISLGVTVLLVLLGLIFKE